MNGENVNIQQAREMHVIRHTDTRCTENEKTRTVI